jgi:outer membrane immunogenic protein
MILKLIGSGIAALSLLAVTFPAEAADLRAPVYKGVRAVVSYYNWTGAYIGFQGGYGFGRSNWDSPVGTSNKPDGFVIGGTLGYNHQVGSWVLGIEGDVSWSDVKGSTACGAFICETRNEWLGTVRGRLGYAFDRFLPYITAGGAYGNIKATNTDPAATGMNKEKFGWTAGAGLEYAFLGNWSAKLEYLYVDLGKADCGATCNPGVLPNNISFRENIVRAGLNYKFSGPVFSRF